MPHLPCTHSSLLRNLCRSGVRAFGTHVCLPVGNFSYQWLRDSCPSTESIHPATRQKLLRTTDAIKDAKPKSVSADKDGLRIEWQSGHKSFYPTEYLARHSSYGRLSAFHHDVRQQPWDLSKISANNRLFLPYESFQKDASQLAAMTQLERDGLLFIQGVPNVETSNETCELRRVAEAFGEIRDTFYGPLWDVKNIKNSRNIAYTNLELGLHMDLLSVQPIPSHIACFSHLKPGTSNTPLDTSSSIAYGIGLKVAPRFSWTPSMPQTPYVSRPPLTSICSPRPPSLSTTSTMATTSITTTPPSNWDHSPTSLAFFRSNLSTTLLRSKRLYTSLHRPNSTTHSRRLYRFWKVRKTAMSIFSRKVMSSCLTIVVSCTPEALSPARTLETTAIQTGG
jgi:hypothetical protein